MSIFNAAIAKSRAKQFGSGNVYGSLLSDNPIGETKDFMNEVDRAQIVGDAQQDYYRTIGDAQRDFYKSGGAQGAALAASEGFGDTLGGFGSLLSTGVNKAVDVGLIKLR